MDEPFTLNRAGRCGADQLAWDALLKDVPDDWLSLGRRDEQLSQMLDTGDLAKRTGFLTRTTGCGWTKTLGRPQDATLLIAEVKLPPDPLDAPPTSSEHRVKWEREWLRRVRLRDVWLETLARHRLRVTGVFAKRILSPDQLDTEGRRAYDYVLRQCDTDAKLRDMLTFVQRGSSRKVSGRTVEAVVTRYPRHHPLRYWWHEASRRVVASPGPGVVLFDLATEYATQLRLWSKTYFDCFGRGDPVRHTMRDGEVLQLPLCQLIFFLWARRTGLLGFIEQHETRLRAFQPVPVPDVGER